MHPEFLGVSGKATFLTNLAVSKVGRPFGGVDHRTVASTHFFSIQRTNRLSGSHTPVVQMERGPPSPCIRLAKTISVKIRSPTTMSSWSATGDGRLEK